MIRVAALVAILLLAGCGAPSDDETRIRETLAAMTAALESGDLDEFMDSVADDFTAGRQGLDRRALSLLVRRERLARDDIRVQRFATDVELVGEGRAVARFEALATGGSGLLPDEGRLWSVETGWRLDGGEWRLISASWTPSLGGS